MNYGNSGIRGRYAKGSTLAYFSQVIRPFERNRNELRKLIAKAFSEYATLMKLSVQMNTDQSGKQFYIIKLPEPIPRNFVEGWRIYINFLGLGKGASQNGYPSGFRVLLILRPIINKNFRNSISNTKKIMEEAAEILDFLKDESVKLVVNDNEIVFNKLLLTNEFDLSKDTIFISGEGKGKLSDIVDVNRRTDIVNYIEDHIGSTVKSKGCQIMFETRFPYNLRTKFEKNFSKLGFNVKRTFNMENGVPGFSSDEYHRVCLFSSFIKQRENDKKPDLYTLWKIDTLTKGIATQNLENQNVSPAIAKMIEMEVLQKMGFEPLELDPNEERVDDSGYIYLSRLDEWLDYETSRSGKYSDILGAVITFGSRRGETYSNVFLINDPRAESEEAGRSKYVVYNEERVAEFLSEKIKLKGMTFRILITKRVKPWKLNRLIQEFESKELKISKIIYLSPMEGKTYSNIERLEGVSGKHEPPEVKVSYKILDGKHAFYQPSQDLRGPFDLGTIYCEQLYPNNTPLSEEDVISLVRLAKRRLYRIYSVQSLRIPEPIALYRSKAKIISKLSNIADSIPLRLLI